MLDIVPTVEFPPEVPFTLQVTAVSDVPVTVAVNCCELPSNTLEPEEETLTVTDGGGGLDELLPPQPPRMMRGPSEQRSGTRAKACAQKDDPRKGKNAADTCTAMCRATGAEAMLWTDTLFSGIGSCLIIPGAF